jgi:hypothetical protein
MKLLISFLLLTIVLLCSCQSTPSQGYFLEDAARTKGAVCLDGTPGLYYHREGTGSGINKWYIHHEGGGWCYNADDCYGRSLGYLGTTKGDPKTRVIEGGYFSTDPKINPQMYNWNSVYLRYCDGASFSGNNATVSIIKDKAIYYRGFRILEAIFSDLFTNRGLNKATDVVVSGCSAGGLATYLHLDWWRNNLPVSIKVVGLPDSGFFLDYESPVQKYHSSMIWVFENQNSTSGVNQDCIAAYKPLSQEWKCIFAQYTSPHIKTPIFPLQAEYDSWQTSNILGSSDPKLINEWGATLTTLVKNGLLNRPQNGIFGFLSSSLSRMGIHCH